MKTKQDLFMEWLADRVPSSSLSDYYFAVTEIESFAHKKKIFSGSLYDVTDSAVSGKLVSTINADKIFRFMHKKQMKTIVDLSQLFHKYTKESENSTKATINTAAEEAVEPSTEGLPANVFDNGDGGTSAVIPEPDTDLFASDAKSEESNMTSNDQPPIIAEATSQEAVPLSRDESGPTIEVTGGTGKSQNKTYYQDDMEHFFLWLGKSSSLSLQERKSIISALRIAQMFLQENISAELALFSEDKSVVKVSIYALLSNPEFKKKNDERQGRYFEALKQLQAYNSIPESAHDTDASSEDNESEDVISADITEMSNEAQTTKPLVQEILIEHGIKFWKTTKAYLFVESKDMPDSVLKLVRRAGNVTSVTAGKRYGNKDCWRIHLKDVADELEGKTEDEDSSEAKPENGKSIAQDSTIATDTGSPAVDPILTFLNNMEIQYIDNRAKKGRLWMLGDMSLKETAAWLRKNGYSFVYCYRGSKSTGWKSAWYLDEGSKASVKVKADKPEQLEESIQLDASCASESKLAPEVSQLLLDDDMLLLRQELEKQSILSLDRLKAINLWAFMNRYALYNISQRLDIYKRVLAKLNSLKEVNRDNQYKLETRTAVYYGDSPAEAFARFCEDIAQKYPLKIRSLLGAKYNGQGSVVLSRDDIKGNGIKLMSPEAFISRELTTQAAVVYGQWICKMCGDNDPPIQIVVPAKVPAGKVEASVEQPSNETERKSEVEGTKTTEVPAEKPASKQEDVNSGDVAKAEQLVLKADLDGMTIEELCEELHTTMVATRKIASSAKHIVQLGEKLIHDEAFVDWEDGADQIEKILDKLLDRNGGYVSAAQLYEFAHSEMQMFLNDNDMDDVRLVYDMAQHLFEKVDYHGKHLIFQSKSHISRSETAVTNVMDLMRNFAKSQGGIFLESDLVQYLQSVGVKTGNLRGLMKVYTHPVFMFYDKGQFILGDSMKINQEWFSAVSKALDNLFDDMGDHMVFRDVQPWWFAQLPSLPSGRPWTHLLLQSVLQHYSKQVGGAHTINAMSGQSADTIHAMLVSEGSEIQSFPDAVVAFLVDDRVDQREFEAEELRLLLVQRGLVAGNELIWNMPKALANDSRFAWDASGQKVTIKV